MNSIFLEYANIRVGEECTSPPEVRDIIENRFRLVSIKFILWGGGVLGGAVTSRFIFTSRFMAVKCIILLLTLYFF